ncbi:MAG: peptidylprolyl isomerase [Verrucomicrobiota bacterium]|nr:peptidylprolyl isomerase [Verrucomicrobiota bacterium]
MKKRWIVIVTAAGILGFGGAKARAAEDAATKDKPAEAGVNTAIVIETSLGAIKAELWADKAPTTVSNFLKYADDKFYDGTIFHRVIKGFMIQGGGFTPDYKQKPTRAPVKNEAKTDVPNDRGALAMARAGVVDSATAQFFINHKDNGFLNHRDETAQGFGYCVFGKITDGLDIVDKIAEVETGPGGPFAKDAPKTVVLIKTIRRAGAPDAK